MPRSAPFLALLAVVFASAPLLGSDTPTAALMFSALAAALSAVLILTHKGAVGGLALYGLVASAALFGVGAVNGWTASGAPEYASLAACFGVFAAAQIGARHGDTVRTLWLATLGLGLALAAVAFMDFIVEPETMIGFERPYHLDRLSTPFLSANTAATFYGVIALMSLAELIRAARRFEPGAAGAVERLSRSAALPAAALLVSLTCVFLSASRAGGAFLGAALLVLVAWELFRGVSGGRRLNLRHAVTGLIVVSVGALAFTLSGDLYADRFVETFGREDARATTFAAYIDAVRLAPWLGHGLGGFAFINAVIADAQNARVVMGQGAAHNVILQWALQGGLAGVAFIGSLAAVWLLMMRRGLNRRNRQTGYMRAAIVIAAFVAAHGMLDYALEIPAFLFLFAWVCGLGAGVATGGSRPLTPGGGPQIADAIRIGAAAVLLVAAALSAWGFVDRSSAVRIAGMDDAAFRAAFDDATALRGSPARLSAIGNRALRLEPLNADLAVRAYEEARRKEPRNGRTELSYAAALSAQAGFVTPAAVAAISRSYTLTPYGERRFALARLDLLDPIWPVLPPRVQEAALREARAFNQVARIERWSVEPERTA